MTDDLQALLREERDVREISQLKYRYLRTLDSKDWDGFADCFVPEATGDYNGLVFDDRAALVAYMRENLGEGLVTMHQAHHPEIEVDGDTATARCYFTVLQVTAQGLHPILAGEYHDRFRRVDGKWQFAERTFAPKLMGDLSRHMKGRVE